MLQFRRVLVQKARISRMRSSPDYTDGGAAMNDVTRSLATRYISEYAEIEHQVRQLNIKIE
jgi:hypothetical protein